MLNIIIDGNYLCYYQAFSLMRRDAHMFSRANLEDLYLRELMGTLCHVIKQHDYGIHKVCVAFDSKVSWRQEVIGEQFVYKDRAEKKKKLDMPKFFKLLDASQELLKSLNFYVFNNDTMESDDWIMLLSNYFWKQNESSLIISADSDLHQLLRQKHEKFIAQYSIQDSRYSIPDKTISSESIENQVDEIDKIFDFSFEQERIGYLQQRFKEQGKKVSPTMSLLTKVLSGDSSDSIPSCYVFKTKNGHPTSFGKSRAEKYVQEHYQESTNDLFIKAYNEEYDRKRIASQVLAIVKGNDLEVIPEIADNIKRNIKLMFLHESILPQQSLNEAITEIEYQFNDMEAMGKFKLMFKNGMFDQESLYRGTKYDFTVRDYNE